MNNSVEEKLKSIGKSIFIKYYEEFKNQNFDTNTMSKKLLIENPKATSIGAQKTRISKAKSIFENKQQILALEDIILSRVDVITIEKARRLLIKEKNGL